MSQIMFKGQPVKLSGVFPQAGHTAPAFTLTGASLADVRLNQFAGRQKILSIVPSLDTPVCAASARKFNARVAGLANVVVLKISMDLPFAQKRFCESEHIENIVMLSAFRYPAFAWITACGSLTGRWPACWPAPCWSWTSAIRLSMRSWCRTSPRSRITTP